MTGDALKRGVEAGFRMAFEQQCLEVSEPRCDSECGVSDERFRIEVDDASVFSPRDSGEELILTWPEGHVATSCCLTVLEGVFRQERLPALSVAANADDIRFWWSFRENCTESASLSVSFIDARVGSKLNWTSPTFAAERPAIQAAWRAADAFPTIR